MFVIELSGVCTQGRNTLRNKNNVIAGGCCSRLDCSLRLIATLASGAYS